MKPKLGVFIGRFQPFHHGHLAIVQQSLATCDQLIIVIGSIKRASTVKNPWNFEERKALIETNLQAISSELADRVSIVGVEDQMYNELVWNESVIKQVLEHAPPQSEIVITGHDKDESTYYLKAFPEWGRIELANFHNLNATRMREAYFAGKEIADIAGLTASTEDFLRQFTSTQRYVDLQQEYRFIESYKASWSKAPFKPVHVTTDSVVICKDHILLVQRGHFPGKGLWALPGGFLEQKEWVWQGLIRELIEETCIDLTIDQLKSYLVKTRVFDHPDRAQIGRVITNGGLFQLPGNQLPKVRANDDAAAAKWFSLKEFWEMSDQLHDDHYFIVKYLFSSARTPDK